jgi:hypothetical protein
MSTLDCNVVGPVSDMMLYFSRKLVIISIVSSELDVLGTDDIQTMTKLVVGENGMNALSNYR